VPLVSVPTRRVPVMRAGRSESGLGLWAKAIEPRTARSGSDRRSGAWGSVERVRQVQDGKRINENDLVRFARKSLDDLPEAERMFPGLDKIVVRSNSTGCSRKKSR